MSTKRPITPANVCFIFFILITLSTSAFLFQKYSQEIMSWVEQLGWFAPILFLVIYCLASIILLPTMVLTLAGGALFGPFFGTLLNLLGATWGAACSFLIARYLLSDWFSRKKGVKLSKLINQAEQKGWLFVALLRLVPVVPFHMVNYGLGVTAIKFRTYLITTFIFLIPAEMIYTYFGYAGMELLSQQESFNKNKCLILFGIAIISLFVFKFGCLHRSKYAKSSLNALSTDEQHQN